MATALSVTTTGLSTITTSIIGGPRTRAERSGPARAMFLGTISPRTTCRATTIVSASTNATGCTRASGTPRAAKTGSSRCATAGSPMAPRPRDAIVIPSCAPAITSETCSIARKVVRAAPRTFGRAAARSGCGGRRSSANSAPTKKALAARSATASEDGGVVAHRRSRRAAARPRPGRPRPARPPWSPARPGRCADRRAARPAARPRAAAAAHRSRRCGAAAVRRPGRPTSAIRPSFCITSPATVS